MLPPKTDEEKRLTRLIAVPFFVILFGGLGLTAARYGTANGFGAMILHVYLVWQIVNLIDLVVIDWGGMMLVDPQHPPFPGTEGAKGYRDFGLPSAWLRQGQSDGAGAGPCDRRGRLAADRVSA